MGSLYDAVSDTAPPPLVSASAGTVSRSDATGVYVDLDRRSTVGPCSYEPRWRPEMIDGHAQMVAAGQPPPGIRCLVVFAYGDIRQPWITTFEGWPT